MALYLICRELTFNNTYYYPAEAKINAQVVIYDDVALTFEIKDREDVIQGLESGALVFENYNTETHFVEEIQIKGARATQDAWLFAFYSGMGTEDVTIDIIAFGCWLYKYRFDVQHCYCHEFNGCSVRQRKMVGTDEFFNKWSETPIVAVGYYKGEIAFCTENGILLTIATIEDKELRKKRKTQISDYRLVCMDSVDPDIEAGSWAQLNPSTSRKEFRPEFISVRQYKRKRILLKETDVHGADVYSGEHTEVTGRYFREIYDLLGVE